MTRDLSIRINSARAVASLANQAFDCKATLETLDIVEAYSVVRLEFIANDGTLMLTLSANELALVRAGSHSIATCSH